MRQFKYALPVAALFAIGSSGCAMSRSAGPLDETREPVELVIDNRNSTNSSITVYVVRVGTRERQRLGTVRLTEVKSFKFPQYLNGASYRFIARETGGKEWASDSFLVTPGDVAEWRTHRAVVWVGERAAGT